MRHVGVSDLTGKWFKNIKDSLVSDNLLQRHCAINCDHCYILAHHVSEFNVLVKESLIIKCDNSVLSRITYSFPSELFD